MEVRDAVWWDMGIISINMNTFEEQHAQGEAECALECLKYSEKAFDRIKSKVLIPKTIETRMTSMFRKCRKFVTQSSVDLAHECRWIKSDLQELEEKFF